MNIWVEPACADGLAENDAGSPIQSVYADETTPLNVSSGDISGTEAYEDDRSGEETDVSGEEGGDETEIIDDVSGSVSEGEFFLISTEDLSEEARSKAIESFKDLLASESFMAVIFPSDSEAYLTADYDSEVKSIVPLGTTVYIDDIEIEKTGGIYYLAHYYMNGTEESAYFTDDSLLYIAEAWVSWKENEYSKFISKLNNSDGLLYATQSAASSSVDDISLFPYSYRERLSALKKNHPKWIFVPSYTGIDFSTAVSNEIGDRSWIRATNFNKSQGFVGSPAAQSGWYLATEAGVSFYMDPRNWLWDHNPDDRLPDGTIFMFEQLTYNSSYHSEAAVQAIISNTFMSGSIPGEDMTYAKAFYDIGKETGISPLHLASRVRQEQGTSGTSALISGNYGGYEGYYNYFNVGANGADGEIIKNGLKYAKDHGWNTRLKALKGGALFVGEKYILRGQDTMYFEKFNVSPDAQSARYTHQYMQNVQAAMSESSTTYSGYIKSGVVNSPFVFKIPVYNNMSGETKMEISGPTHIMRLPGRVSENTDNYSNAEKAANVDEIMLTVIVNTGSKNISWSSSDETVAKVDANGIVRSVGTGTCKITARCEDITGKPAASYEIKVVNPLTDISFSDSEISIRRADTVIADVSGLSAEDISANCSKFKAVPVFWPEDSTDTETVTWKSSNSKVAKVSADGEITAVGVGKATITATATGSSLSKKPSCSFTVNVVAPVISITLSNPGNRTELTRGESIRLVTSYLPKDATGDTKTVWTSSDESIVTVDENGIVHAINAGEADVCASIYKSCASVRITVTNTCVNFYDVSGEEKIRSFDVSFNEPVPGRIYDEMSDYYGSLAREDEFFAGFFTMPFGNGIYQIRDRIISSGALNLYPYYQSTACEFYVVPVGSFEYTGSAVKPVPEVYAVVETIKDGAVVKEYKPLTLNTEYKLSYSNNVSVNTNPRRRPSVTVTGCGNFSGKKTLYFDIVPVTINESSVSVNDVKTAYTGRVIKSGFAVYRNGKKLRQGTDYTLTYPATQPGAYIEEGSWPVVITGKGAYSGKITANEIISKEIFLNRVTVSKIPNQVFDISGNEPPVTVKYGKIVLTKDVDYTVEYENNDRIGTATVTVKAVEGSGYTGTRTVSFRITGKSLNNVRVYDASGNNPIVAKDYTGFEDDVKQSGYILKYGKTVLTESRDGISGDYTVSYNKISGAGTAQIIFTGINGYTGKLTKTYKIKPKKLESVFTPDNDISCNYLKGGAVPEIEIYDNGVRLEKNKDYTISYYDNTSVTREDTKRRPRYVIRGKGNYTGSITGYFFITDGDFGNTAKVVMTVSDIVYQKRAGVSCPVPVIKDSNGKTLVNNRDYKIVSYTYAENTTVKDKKGNETEKLAGDEVDRRSDIPDAGTKITVTVEGAGNYKGEGNVRRSVTYSVFGANLSKAGVKVLYKKYYDHGRPVMITGEDIKVTYGKTVLCEGTDYIIDESTYKKNISQGTATVVIRGIGPNYGGSKTVSFVIARKSLLFSVD